jgi:transmembrane sensor
MNRINVNKLVFLYLTGNISEEEKKSLQDWIDMSDAHRRKFERIADGTYIHQRYKSYKDFNAKEAWEKFNKKYFPIRRITFSVMRYAAILMLPILGISMWMLLQNKSMKPQLSHEAYVAMIKSERLGKNQAVLILPNGKTVRLHSALNSEKSINADNIVMAQPKTQASQSVEDNKIFTQKGSEYWLTFEDKTVVHLNYNTSLTYPAHFGENDRTVYLDGEAYFQVAKDSKRPFRVVTSSGIVREYGTTFNVNTNAENGLEVVLVEGSISLTSHNGKECMLAPGEMATLQSTGRMFVNKVDVEPYVAWNKGQFVFDNYTLERIMKVLSQWYGKKVIFGSEDIKEMQFIGNIDKYGTIQPLLNAIMSVTGLDVQMRGNLIEINKP